MSKTKEKFIALQEAQAIADGYAQEILAQEQAYRQQLAERYGSEENYNLCADDDELLRQLELAQEDKRNELRDIMADTFRACCYLRS